MGVFDVLAGAGLGFLTGGPMGAVAGGVGAAIGDKATGARNANGGSTQPFEKVLEALENVADKLPAKEAEKVFDKVAKALDRLPEPMRGPLEAALKKAEANVLGKGEGGVACQACP